MTDQATLPADRQLLCYERFAKRLREELRALVTEDLIAEYRHDPLGRHSDALNRVLNWIHRAPAFGIYSPKPCREWCLVALPVTPGEPPTPIDGTVYTDEREALHAWFVAHVERLKAG
ncbi:MAG: hypothetical protein ACU85V_03195 [Gammaproteobacteria bacterium]